MFPKDYNYNYIILENVKLMRYRIISKVHVSKVAMVVEVWDEVVVV